MDKLSRTSSRSTRTITRKTGVSVLLGIYFVTQIAGQGILIPSLLTASAQEPDVASGTVLPESTPAPQPAQDTPSEPETPVAATTTVTEPIAEMPVSSDSFSELLDTAIEEAFEENNQKYEEWKKQLEEKRKTAADALRKAIDTGVDDEQEAPVLTQQSTTALLREYAVEEEYKPAIEAAKVRSVYTYGNDKLLYEFSDALLEEGETIENSEQALELAQKWFEKNYSAITFTSGAVPLLSADAAKDENIQYALFLEKAFEESGKWYLSFKQYAWGREVDGTSVVMVLHKQDRKIEYISSSFKRSIDRALFTERTVAITVLLPLIQNVLKLEDPLPATALKGQREVVWMNAGKPVLAYKINIVMDEPFGDWIFYVDALSGKVLRHYNRLQFSDEMILSVKGEVNSTTIPLKNVGVNVFPQNSSYTTNEKGELLLPEGANGLEVYLKDAATELYKGSISGENQMMKKGGVSEFTSGTGVTMPTVEFSANDEEKDAVAVWYYMQSLEQLMQPLLDTAFTKKPTQVVINSDNSDRIFGGCASYYSSATKTIEMGRGGCGQVALRSAPDLSMHEYAHAKIDTVHALRAINNSEEGALSEGLADYFVAATNGRTLLRTGLSGEEKNLENVKRFREIKASDDSILASDWTGDIHSDGQIIAGALWDLRGSMDSAKADKLIASALLYQPQTFEEFEVALLLANDKDANISNGTEQSEQIINAFYKHGIGQASTNIAQKLGETTISVPAITPTSEEQTTYTSSLIGEFQEISGNKKDKLGNTLVHGNEVRDVYVYDRTQELWSNPESSAFRGFSASGEFFDKGNNGTQGQGTLRYEGTMLPWNISEAQRWNVLNEGVKSAFSIQNDTLRLENPGQAVLLEKSVSDLVHASNVLLATRVKLDEGSKGLRMGLSTGKNTDALERTIDFTLEEGKAILGGESFFLDTKEFHTYTLRKATDTITLDIDGVEQIQASYENDFTSDADLKRGLFVASACTDTCDLKANIDYIRFERNPVLALGSKPTLAVSGGNLPDQSWINAQASSTAKTENNTLVLSASTENPDYRAALLLATDADFLLSFKAKTSVSDEKGSIFEVANGEKAMSVEFSKDTVLLGCGNDLVKSAAITTNDMREYSLSRKGDIITLNRDGETLLERAYESFCPQSGSYVRFGLAESAKENTMLTLESLALYKQSLEFTPVTHALWAETKGFPEHTYVVATEQGVDIIDATTGNNYWHLSTSDGYIFPQGTTPRGVKIAGGKLAIMLDGENDAMILVDFSADTISRIENGKKIDLVANIAKKDETHMNKETLYPEFTRIDNIALSEVTVLQNEAEGKIVEADLALLADGNRTTELNSTEKEIVATYNFETSKVISSLVYTAGTQDYSNAKIIVVETSNDGNDYVTHHTQDLARLEHGVKTTLNFTPISTQHVRVTLKDSYSSDSLQAAEIELYGDNASQHTVVALATDKGIIVDSPTKAPFIIEKTDGEAALRTAISADGTLFFTNGEMLGAIQKIYGGKSNGTLKDVYDYGYTTLGTKSLRTFEKLHSLDGVEKLLVSSTLTASSVMLATAKEITILARDNGDSPSETRAKIYSFASKVKESDFSGNDLQLTLGEGATIASGKLNLNANAEATMNLADMSGNITMSFDTTTENLIPGLVFNANEHSLLVKQQDGLRFIIDGNEVSTCEVPATFSKIGVSIQKSTLSVSVGDTVCADVALPVASFQNVILRNTEEREVSLDSLSIRDELEYAPDTEVYPILPTVLSSIKNVELKGSTISAIGHISEGKDAFFNIDTAHNTVVNYLSSTTSPALPLSSLTDASGVLSGAYVAITNGTSLFALQTPTSNLAPSAPSQLFVNSKENGAQAGYTNNARLSPGQTPVFSAVFVDPNVDDAATAYRMQVSTDSTFKTISHWDSGETPKSFTNEVKQGQRSEDIAYEGKTLTTGATYYARVQLFDKEGQKSAMSLPATFVFSKYSQVLQLSAQTKDKNNKIVFPGGNVTSVTPFNLAGNVFLAPTEKQYSGWGFDGSLYNNGQKQTGGEIIYNASTLPNEHGSQSWQATGAENAASIVDENLRLRSDTNVRLEYTRAYDASTTSNFLLTTAISVQGEKPAFFSVYNGDKAILLQIVNGNLKLVDSDGKTIVEKGSIPSGNHKLEVRREAENVKVSVDGYSQLMAEYSALPSTVEKKISFGKELGGADQFTMSSLSFGQAAQLDSLAGPVASWKNEQHTARFPENGLVTISSDGVRILGDTQEVWMSFSYGENTVLGSKDNPVLNAFLAGSTLVMVKKDAVFTADFEKDTMKKVTKDGIFENISGISVRNSTNSYTKISEATLAEDIRWSTNSQSFEGNEYVILGLGTNAVLMNVNTFLIDATIQTGELLPIKGNFTSRGDLVVLTASGEQRMKLFSSLFGKKGTIQNPSATASDADFKDAKEYLALDARITDAGVETLIGNEKGAVLVKTSNNYQSSFTYFASQNAEFDASKVLKGENPKVSITRFGDKDAFLFVNNDAPAIYTIDLATTSVIDILDNTASVSPANMEVRDIALHPKNAMLVMGHALGMDVFSNDQVDAPVDIKASPDGAESANQINVTWEDTSNNEVGFMVFRSESSTVSRSDEVIGFVEKDMISFQDKNVEAGKTYYYKVYAVSQGDVRGSTVVMAKTGEAPIELQVCKANCELSSIPEALNAIPENAPLTGFIVKIDEGVYTEPLVIEDKNVAYMRFEKEGEDKNVEISINNPNSTAVTIKHVDNVVIEGLRISGNMKRGIDSSGDNQIFRDNIITGTSEQAISIGSSNVTFENNLMFSAATCIVVPAASDNIRIINNTCDSISGTAINVGTTAGLIVKDNAVTNSTVGINIAAGSTNVQTDYNYLYGNLTDYATAISQGVHDRNSTSTPPASNPRYAPGYFLQHIAAGDTYNSPLIDAGSVSAEEKGYTTTRTTRTDGVADGGIVDIGYHAVATTPAPPSAPAAPLIVSVVQGSNLTTDLNVNWTDRSTSELGFKVYRSMNTGVSDTTGTLVADLPADTQVFNDTGLTPGTTYYYQVYAYNNLGGNPSPVEGVGTTNTAGLTILQVCPAGCAYSTIQAAVNATTGAGDYEIRIMPGTYIENVAVTNRPAANITFTSNVQGGEVIIDGGTGVSDALTITNDSNITLQNLVLQHGRYGLNLNNADNITVQNTYILENKSAGIMATAGSTGNTLTNSVVASNGDNTASDTHGVYITGGSSFTSFTHNTISHNANIGVYLHSGGTLNNFTNNLVTYNGLNGVVRTLTGTNTISGIFNYNNYYKNARGDKILNGAVVSSPNDTTLAPSYADARYNLLSTSAVKTIASDSLPSGKSNVETSQNLVTTVYVSSSDGNDATGDGSRNLPYRTIQQAVNHPRNTKKSKFQKIDIAPGTYIENVLAYNNVELVGDSTATTIITAANAANPVITAGHNGQHYGMSSLKVSNIRIKSGSTGIEMLATGIDLDVQNALITDNNGSARGGIYSGSDVAFIKVANTTFTNNYVSSASAAINFPVRGRYPDITNNTVNGTHAFGIFFQATGNTPVIATGNNVSGNNRGHAISFGDAADVTITGNTLTNGSTPTGISYSGITVLAGSGTVNVSDNTLSNQTSTNAHSGIFVTNLLANTVITANNNTLTDISNPQNGYNSGVYFGAAGGNVSFTAMNNALTNIACGRACGITMEIPASTTSTATITGNTLTNVGHVSFDNQAAIWLFGMQDMTVTNNTITTTPTNRGIYLQNVAATLVNRAEVTNNTINGAGYEGIHLATTSYVDIRDNTITNSEFEGIRVNTNANNTRIEHNKILNGRQDGIAVARATGVEIRNNLVAYNGSNDSSGLENSSGNHGINIGELAGAPTANVSVIEENTIANNYGSGIEVVNSTVVQNLQDNVIANNGIYGVAVWSAAAFTAMSNNTFSNNTLGGVETAFYSLGTNGNIEQDPEFVDRDYNLKNTSPILTNGTGGIKRGWQDATSSTTAFTEVYVNSSTGNDTTGDGTVGNPYRTIQAGVRNVANPTKSFFTTVVVSEGVYGDQVVLDRPVRLRAAAGANPTISVPSNDALFATTRYYDPALAEYNGAHYVDVEGFQFTGSKRALYIKDAVKGVRFVNNDVTNMTHGAVIVETISGAANAGYRYFGNLLLEQNTFTNVATANIGGAFYSQATMYPSNVTISDNVISGSYLGFAIIDGSRGTTVVTNNTVASINGGSPITVFNTGNAVITGNTIANSTSVTNGTYGGLTLVNTIGDVTANNNSVQNITAGASTHAGIVLAQVAGNIQANGNTIQNQSVASAGWYGGLFMETTAPSGAYTFEARNNVLTDNTGTGVGKSIYAKGSAALANAIITDNTITNVGSTSALDHGAIHVSSSKDALVQNNTISDTNNQDGVFFDAVAALVGNRAEILDNTITDAGRRGIYVNNSQNVDVKNNTAENLGLEGLFIYNNSNNAVIEHNAVRNARYDGIGYSASTGGVIKNNRVTNNGTNDVGTASGIFVGRYGGAPTATLTAIEQNTVAHNLNGGIYVTTSATVSAIRDNVIAYNGEYGLEKGTATITTHENNSYYRNTFKDVGTSFTLGANGNVAEDPQFVDRNYNLKDTSPVLTTGTGGIKRGWQDATFTTTAFTEVYVNDSTGNDTTGDGTIGNPYKTIQAGVRHPADSAKSFFSTVKVVPGTYVGGASQPALTIDRPVSIVSATPGTTYTLQPNEASLNGVVYVNKATDATNATYHGAISGNIDEMTIKNAARGIYFRTNTAYPSITKVNIQGMSTGGVVNEARIGGLVLKDSIIQDVTAHALMSESSYQIYSPEIQTNLFKDNLYGVRLYNAVLTPVLFIGNVITGTTSTSNTYDLILIVNANGGVLRSNQLIGNNSGTGIAGLRCYSCTNTSVKNNLVKGMAYNIYLDFGTNNNVTNNTVDAAYSAGRGIYVADTGTNVRYNIVTNGVYGIQKAAGGIFDYNLVFNNSAANYLSYAGGAGDIVSDPLYSEAGAGDYHLVQSSPAVDAGPVLASAEAMDGGTTNPDATPDAGNLDWGYHYNLEGSSAPTTLAVAPSNIRVITDATTPTPTKLTLNWTDNTPNETNFRIYSSTTSPVVVDPANLVGTVSANATTFTHSNLPTSTTHYYKVAALMPDGSLLVSNQVAGTTTEIAAELETCLPGCTTQTYTTIQAALDAVTNNAAADYTVKIYPGTFTENLTINTKTVASLTITAKDTNNAPTIYATSTANYVLNISSIPNTTISYVTLTRGSYGVVASSMTNFKIENTYLVDNRVRGAEIATSPNVIIRNNVMAYNGDPSIAGASGTGLLIYSGTTNATIENNTFSNNTGYGIHVNNGGAASTVAVLRNNNMTFNGGSGFQRDLVSFTVTSAQNNNVFGNKQSTYGTNYTDQTGTNGNISVDPLYVNKLYHVLASSPVKGAGVSGVDIGPVSTPTQATFNTLYVNGATGNDENADGSIGDPYKTIQSAVDSVNAPEKAFFARIRVLPGVYQKPSASLPTVSIDHPVMITGDSTTPTLLSFSQTQNVISLAQTRYGNFDLTFDNLDITGGRAGISTTNANVGVGDITITNSTIRNNGTSAGAYFHGNIGALTLDNNLIQGNREGGVYVVGITYGDLNVTDNMLSQNYFNVVPATPHGGLWLNGGTRGTITVTDNIVTGNQNGLRLGAGNNKSAVITGNSITGQRNTQANGANFYLTGAANVLFEDNIIKDNTSVSAASIITTGARLETISGTSLFNNNRFENNQGSRAGLYLQDVGPNVTITNNTFENNNTSVADVNVASQGYGGIYLYQPNVAYRNGTVVIQNNTINRLGGDFNGIVTFDLFSNSLNISDNTISKTRNETGYGAINLRSSNAGSAITINNNTIDDVNGTYAGSNARGIYFDSITGTSGVNVQVTNNTIKNFAGNAGAFNRIGIFTTTSTYINIANNIISENKSVNTGYMYAIQMHSSTNNIVDSNIIDGANMGIYLYTNSTGHMIENNLIRQMKDWGILLDSGSSGITIQDNRIVQTGQYGGVVLRSSTTNNKLIHNTIANNAAYGVQIESTAQPFNEIRDNIFAYNNIYGIYNQRAANQSLGANNTFYQNGTSAVNAVGTGNLQVNLAAATGTQLVDDPKFANENYQVLTGSPILGTGTASANRGWRSVTTATSTADIYVNGSTGNDTTGDGTIGNPYKTIQAGVRNVNGALLDVYAGPQDWFTNVHVASGTYTSANNSPAPLVIIDRQVRLVGEGATKPALIGSPSVDVIRAGGSITNLDQAYGSPKVAIENLEIRNGLSGIQGSTISGFTLLDSNILNNSTGGGVAISSSSGELNIQNNTFSGNGANGANGALWVAGNSGAVTLINNTFTNNKNAVNLGNLQGNNAAINNNTITNNNSTTIGGTNSVAGLTLSNAGYIDMIGNTVTGNISNSAGYTAGIRVEGSTGGMVFDNNEVANNDGETSGVYLNTINVQSYFNSNHIHHNTRSWSGLTIRSTLAEGETHIVSGNEVNHNTVSLSAFSGAWTKNAGIAIIYSGSYGITMATGNNIHDLEYSVSNPGSINSVSLNTYGENTSFPYGGIVQANGYGVSIDGNTVERLSLNSNLSPWGIGIYSASTQGPLNNTVSNNTVRDIGGGSGWAAAGIRTRESRNITFSGNLVTGANTTVAMNGIQIRNASNDVIVENNTVMNLQGSGILFDVNLTNDAGTNTGQRVEGNFVRNAAGQGIAVTHTSNGMIIRNNTSVQNGGSGVYLTTGAVNVTLDHNLLANNLESGLYKAGAVTFPILTNNVFAFNGSYGIHNASSTYISLGNFNSLYKNALGEANAYGNTSGTVELGGTGLQLGNDPLFANELYHVVSTSPILGTGMSGTNRGPVTQTTVAALTDLYVDAATGNDANNGLTPSTAYRTIQAAVNNANGVTLANESGTQNWFTRIYIAPGTYVDDINVNSQLSLIASAGEKPRIEALNTSDYALQLGSSTDLAAYYTRIEGLDLTKGKAGIYTQGGAKIATFTGNRIHDNTGTHGGIYTDTIGSYEITNNQIDTNPGATGGGIYFAQPTKNLIVSTNQLVRNNKGIYISDNGATPATVEYNRVENGANGQSLVVINGDGSSVKYNVVRNNSGATNAGIVISGAPNTTVAFNTINNNSSGIGLHITTSATSNLFSNLIFNNTNGLVISSSNGTTANNTTIYNNTTNGLQVGASTNVIARNNIVLRSVNGINASNTAFAAAAGFTNNIVDQNSTNYVGGITNRNGIDNNQAGDPLFFNVSNFDFRLKQNPPDSGATSIAVDSGSGNVAGYTLIGNSTTRSDAQPDTGVIDRGYHYLNDPLPPSGLIATRDSVLRLTKVNLSWVDDSPSNDAYNIYYSLSPSVTQSSTFVATVDGDTTSYAVSNLTPGTIYYFRVYAMTNGGGAAGSNIASVQTGSVPSAPTILYTDQTNAQTGRNNPVDIPFGSTPRFSAIYNDADTVENEKAIRYTIQVSSDPTFGSVYWESTTDIEDLDIGARVPDIIYTGTPLVSGVRYYWRIRFVDDGEAVGVYSPNSTNYFRLNSAPTAPTSLQANLLANPADLTDLTPDLSAIYADVDATDQAIKYQMQVSADNTFSSVLWDTGVTALGAALDQGSRMPALTYAGPALTEGTTYYYRVKFFDAVDTEGAWSSGTDTFRVVPTAPTVYYPANNASVMESKTGVMLSHTWSSAHNYRVQIATDAGFGALVLDYSSASPNTTMSTFRVGQPIGGGAYAVGGAGASLPSGKYYVRTKAVMPNSTEGSWSTATAFVVDAPAGSQTYPGTLDFSNVETTDDTILPDISTYEFTTKGTAFTLRAASELPLTNTAFPGTIPAWNGSTGFGVAVRWSVDGGATYSYLSGDSESEWDTSPEDLTYFGPGTPVSPTTLLDIPADMTGNGTDTTYQFEFRYRLKAGNAVAGDYTGEVNYILTPTF